MEVFGIFYKYYILFHVAIRSPNLIYVVLVFGRHGKPVFQS